MQKRDTNRDIKLHQLRDLEKVRLVAEESIGDHKREATHDIVLHWPARRSLRDRSMHYFSFSLVGDVRQSHVPGPHFSSNSRNRILKIREGVD